MFDSLQFTALEIVVIVLAFVIMFALLRVFRRDSLADRKRQEIEIKRAALIAKRKAATKETADAETDT